MCSFWINIRKYSAICAIIGAVIMITRSYYHLEMADKNNIKYFIKIEHVLNDLENKTNKLTVDVQVLQQLNARYKK
jgi:hypothetical protein